MFNRKPNTDVFFIAFALLLMLTYGCKEEVNMTFSEEEVISDDIADISIIYPRVKDKSDAATNINKTVEDHMVNAISFTEEVPKDIPLDDAIQKFNKEYSSFKEGFPSSEQRWNASIEGEVIYQSPQIITIAMNTYLDTGGAHGNDNITFLNFNAKTGEIFTNEDLLEINDELIDLAKTYFEKEASDLGKSMDDYFFGEPFHLPANIGFSDEGIVFLYNVYEIASFTDGYTEFVIPFEELSSFLKLE